MDNDARNRAIRNFYSSPDAVPDADRSPDPRRRLGERWSSARDAVTAAWDSYVPSQGDSAHRASTLRRIEDEVRGFETFDALYLANFSFDLAAALRAMPVETVVMEFVVPAESHFERQADVLLEAMPRARAVTLSGSDRQLVTRDSAIFAEAIRSAVALPF